MSGVWPQDRATDLGWRTVGTVSTEAGRVMPKDAASPLIQRGEFADLYDNFCWTHRCRASGGHLKQREPVLRNHDDHTSEHVYCPDHMPGWWNTRGRRDPTVRYDEQAYQRYSKARDLAERIYDRIRQCEYNAKLYHLQDSLRMRPPASYQRYEQEMQRVSRLNHWAHKVGEARERYWKQSFRSPLAESPAQRARARSTSLALGDMRDELCG